MDPIIVMQNESTMASITTTTATTQQDNNTDYIGVDWGSEKLVRAQEAIRDNRWDLEAWGILIREAQTRYINEVRPFFEELVANFPTCGRYWKIYIEQEMRSRNFEKVEKLFQRCLMKVLNIELWKLYLGYVKETKAALTTFKEKMAQAYDFALDKIGMDIQSYSIWNDYVTFLKGVEAIGSYAENQKISAVRKVYQRGVVNPMVSIETFWKDYMAFEQSINPIIAEKMGIERSRDYMNARRVAKEFETITRGLNKNIPSTPPTGTLEEIKQVELWKKYIVWERSNPLRSEDTTLVTRRVMFTFEQCLLCVGHHGVELWKKYIAWEKSNPLRSEDTTLVTRRVMFAFEQCLLCVGHHPDIWYEAAQFLDQSSKLLIEKGDVTAAKMFSDEAANMFERATGSTLKSSMLLYFAYADFEEGRVKYEKVHQIYQRFLEIEEIDPTLAYIQYMKFARRAEGIKSARNVFKRAREDPRSKWQIFVAAALMEYYCSKDKNIAFRIFELGLKKFSNSPQYILCYVDYLSHLNEDNNTRVLFERVLSSGSLEPEKSVEIWNRFLEFESNIGDLASIVKVEKRRSSVLEKVCSKYHNPDPKIDPILSPNPVHIAEFEGKETAQLVDRYKFLDLYPCSPAELRSIGYSEVTAQATKASFHALTGSILKDGLDDHEATQRQLPRPDLSQMIPFKPKRDPFVGEHPVPGGTFPLPPAAAHLCTLLPPPTCFHGPFVIIDSLIDIFNKIQIPETPPALLGENGCDTKLFDLAKSVHWVVDVDNGGRKKRKVGGGDESDDDDASGAPPINDIYRQRQQKRVK